MAHDDKHAGGQGQAPEREGPPPLLEWVVAALGLVLVLASVGVLGWHALKSPGEGAPAIAIEVRSIKPQGGSYLVEVRVRNTGESAAADLHIAGELWSGDRQLQRSELVLDHLPAGSSRQAGFFFSQDPRGHRLELRAEGFQRP